MMNSHPEDGVSNFLSIVGNYLPVYTDTHPRTQKFLNIF
jgi:hypothetical protein